MAPFAPGRSSLPSDVPARYARAANFAERKMDQPIASPAAAVPPRP